MPQMELNRRSAEAAAREGSRAQSVASLEDALSRSKGEVDRLVDFLRDVGRSLDLPGWKSLVPGADLQPLRFQITQLCQGPAAAAAASERASALAARAAELERQRDELAAQLAAARAAVQQAAVTEDSHARQATGQLADFSARVESLTRYNGQLQDALDAANRALEESRASAAGALARLANAERDMSAVTGSAAELASQLDVTTEECGRLRQEADATSAAAAALRAQLASLEARTVDLQAAMNAKEERLRQVGGRGAVVLSELPIIVQRSAWRME